ncbi:alanine:cation symporter family protein [Faecalibacterium prausnitzii]|uniref:alanine:cation symporter family protein n=1 Tax=Faecalibacterium prausnitzii TaxID=853 RepID=UPI003AAB7BD0
MFGIFEVFADTIVICTLTAMVILCSGAAVNTGAATVQADHQRLYHHLRRLGFHLYRRGPVLLCFFHHHRLGPVWFPVSGVPVPQR